MGGRRLEGAVKATNKVVVGEGGSIRYPLEQISAGINKQTKECWISQTELRDKGKGRSSKRIKGNLSAILRSHQEERWERRWQQKQ